MKTYPRDAKIDWDAVRKTAAGIHSTPTEVIVYESADELPPPAPKPPDTRSEVEREIAASPALQALVGEMARTRGVTKEALVLDLSGKASA